MVFGAICLVLTLLSTKSWAQNDSLRFPISNPYDPTTNKPQNFDLGDPSGVKQTIVFDPVTGKYVFKETIGGSEMNYRNPSMMTLDEYLEYERQKSLKSNWKDKIDEQTGGSKELALPIKIPGKVFENIMGSNEITIRPQGSVELSFGVNSSRYDNPILPVRQRKITRFDFQQQIQLNLVGQIGTKLKLNTSYNTQAAFDFDNITKLGYSGDEDQILQRIELGNVSMPSQSSLIPGSQTLFGAYSKLRFGRLTVDAIAASSKGKRQEINITGKAQIQPFEIAADNYEANRHYFLNFHFRDQYDKAMAQLPIVASEVNITRLEVWLTNRINNTENTRNILAFTDLGEAKASNLQGNPGALSLDTLPSNGSNGLYNWLSTQPSIRGFNNSVITLGAQSAAPGPFQQAIHYEKVENARKLTESEYSYNALLGFISLNQPLNNDEVLAVSYEYTYRGKTYQVGEFSTDGIEGQGALILKLLKPTITNPSLTLWDLMMKNVYSIGAYQVDKQGFRMDVLYNNPETSLPIPFFPYDGLDDKQLVTLVEMDKININGQQFSDGLFDFAPIVINGNKAETGGTINTKNGRVYFTTVEPFGRTLAAKMKESKIPDLQIKSIAFTELYDSTKTAAQQIPSKNRFLLKGEYQSSVSSDIPLNALNVPEGAVSVTAGGIKLVEGQDYTVDYSLGRVKILNSGILESNTPIKISIESNSVFGFQAKSLLGTHLNYRINKDFNVGATWMRMMERPVTQKVDIGSEPYKNNVIGFDMNYRADLPFLTKAVDFLPFISTKEKSFMSFKGEFAHLIPGQPKAIGKQGISYIDDFEGSQSTIDLRTISAWKLAATPQGQSDLFPEGILKNLGTGFNRSKLSWYLIDPLFYQSNTLTPKHIKDNPQMLADSRMRFVNQTDIFPNLQQQYGSISNIPILEVAYYPTERGMYNFDTTNTVNPDGSFNNPTARWGGISRALSTNDFELANIEYIQFWVLDPFNEDAENANPASIMNGGSLYFNLGNISEDVLADSRKSFENGLPIDGGLENTNFTPWAKVPTQQVVVNAFDNNPNSRINQDLGLDGYNNQEERESYTSFVNWVQSNPTLTDETRLRMLSDPSNDDYNFYRDDVYDQQEFNILQRYKKYNGVEGNSPTTEMSDTANADSYPTQATNMPDLEDINQDNNLSESESYFQYKVNLRPNEMVVGQNFITNMQTYQNGNKTEKWYQFKIPLRQPERVVNGIRDFRSIRFMRMFLKDFDEEVVLRFARLEFIRGEWRQYLQPLIQPGEVIQTDPDITRFNIGAVNLEENSEKSPTPYKLPPGIIREVDPSQPYPRQINEQSLTLEVCGLQDGDARAAYRNVQFDIRTYKKLKMFVHAEELTPNSLKDKDLTLFMRLGTDFTDNYYEYELPLNLTPWGTVNDAEIWPESNNLEIVFDELLELKKKRNKQGVPFNFEFLEPDPANGDRRIKVKGNPNLQGIRSIMIGIRNPSVSDENPWPDDGLSKCAQIWVNELRLSDFVDDGGSAAVAQLQVQAADFATLSASSNYSGLNWGAVDSRVQDRQRNQKIGVDMQSTVQLGQFFGTKARITLPFFYGYSLGIINPEYDPYNPDIKLRGYDKDVRKQYIREGQDFTERRSYNFQGIRKERPAGKTAHFFDFANWTGNYGYSETTHRDFNTKYDRTKIWKGGVAYAYTFTTPSIEPFKKIKFLQKSKWLAFIRETNFNPTPKNISLNNDMTRNYNERQIKNNLVPTYEFKPVYVKNFTWNKSYKIGWDFTKNLKGTFGANTRSIFDEADGRVDRKEDPEGFRKFKDTIRTQFGTLGKALDYSHDYSLTYNLPLDKIPAFDWITSNVKYSGSFNWQRSPLGQENYGNIIQNRRTINAQAQANMMNLYNKVPFLKKINSNTKSPRVKVGDLKKGNLSVKTTVTEKKKSELIPDKPLEEMTKKERRKWERKKRRFERKQKREESKLSKGQEIAGKLLMSVRNISTTYSQTDGTLLPGYNQDARFLGYNPAMNGDLNGFLFGRQSYSVSGKPNDYDIGRVSAENNWLVKNSALNRQHTISHSNTFTGKATLEPIKDMSIDFNMNRTFTKNTNDFFRWNEGTSQFESQSKMSQITLTYSTVSIKSAFNKIDKTTYSSQSFENLLANRKLVSEILGTANSNSSGLKDGYFGGYSGSQQEVVIGAFLSAYTTGKVDNRSVNPLKALPMPNWSLNYNGLSKLEVMKKYVKTFVIRHGYSSNVSMAGVQTNLNAALDGNGQPTTFDLNNNFISENNVQAVTIAERFSPLIGVDATWNLYGQGLITKFELKRDRSATLSLNNNQVTEVSGTEIVFGTGYKLEKVKFPIQFQGKDVVSPLNIRFDLSFRENLTVIRKIVEGSNLPTAGQRVVSIKSSMDYNLSTNLTLQFYYDQVLTTPKIATAFPTGNLSTGIRIRFNLGGL